MEENFIAGKEPAHTEQMQDIISTPPRWLYRWGITLVLAIALVCLLISMLINFPEAVKTRIKMLSVHAPDSVVSKDSAILIKLLVNNDTPIKKGDQLAVLENATGRFVVKAPVGGKVTYAGIIHENERFQSGRNIFFITAYNSNDFYGEIIIPQTELHKVKPGQTVLIMPGNGDEIHATFKGIIRYIISDKAKNGEYFGEVEFDRPKNNDPIAYLSPVKGMVTDAEIITAKTTLFQRLIQSLTKTPK